MIKIKFNDENRMLDVSFSRVGNVVVLAGITNENASGFTTWRMDGKTQLGDFSGFTTIYRVLDNAVQYSCDGSVYEPEPAPEPEQPAPTPTDSERITALEDTITALIGGISDAV